MNQTTEAGSPSGDNPDQQYALTEDGHLKVYSAGETTVLGFAGQDVPPEFNAAHYRAAISELLTTHNSKVVAFDLTGVRLVPSGMLGLIVSLRNLKGVEPRVQIFNPSKDVREVLSISRLDTMIEVREVDVDA